MQVFPQKPNAVNGTHFAVDIEERRFRLFNARFTDNSTCPCIRHLAGVGAPAIGSADELFVPDAYYEALFAPGITSPVPLLDGCFIDDFHDSVGRWKTKNSIPIGAGAWHWFNQDFRNHNDGYGIPGMRGTFFW